MNITVFGSTGRTGRHILAEGLRRGHRITAASRRPHLLHDTAALAAVVTGDGRDPHTVRTAITDADAVIAIIGAASRNGPHHAAAVAKVITKAMSELGVRRLAITSAYPIVAKKPRLAITMLRLALANAYADLADMERIVATSEADWTIVRLNRLTDKPARGRVDISRGLVDKPAAIARADAAAALLDITEDPTYTKTAVNITG